MTTVVTTHVYDHRGRLVDTRRQVDSQAEYIQSRLSYNQVGQLRQKKLHGDLAGADFIASIDYAYNERGWTTHSRSGYFTQVLRYQDSLGTGSTARYNGSIAEQHWGYGTATPNAFKYTYDALDRLTDGQSTGTVMREQLGYDDMGNIVTLIRDGGTAIAYGYATGRLSSLSGGLTGSYSYDANGNATADRQGFAYTYNYLNQPKTAAKTGTGVGYLYAADGTKLRRTVTVGGTATRDYVRGVEYHDFSGGSPAWELLHTEEGYVEYDAGTGTYGYLYHLGDHLGNVRAVLRRTGAGTAVVEQKNDYYPFGLQKVIASGGINSYLYNGKEIQGELGQYDYGARFYDPVIGRWNVSDAMAESYYSWSPYNYTLGNPIKFIDPNGMFVAPIYDREGNFLGTDDEGLQGEAIIMDKRHFRQGMAHGEARAMDLSPNLGFMNEEAKSNMGAHFAGLKNRPDYDGFVSVSEGIAWAKAHPGALDEPSPDNMLYLDASKLDFGNISISDFANGVGKASPINLLNPGNLASSLGNAKLRATVYALGRVNMMLHSDVGVVSVVNDYNQASNRATDYDWNIGGGSLRNSLIQAERSRTGLNDSHGFRTYYYGRGTLNNR